MLYSNMSQSTLNAMFWYCVAAIAVAGAFAIVAHTTDMEKRDTKAYCDAVADGRMPDYRKDAARVCKPRQVRT